LVKSEHGAPTLLIVVRDPDLRNLLVSIVGELGFAVRLGPEASPEAEAMTEVNGIPDAALVHARLDDWGHISALARQSKIILLTSDTKPIAAEEVGAFCVVPMPFDLEDLEVALARCLREVLAGAN
jgi:DNA-binding NtrC family response regulator